MIFHTKHNISFDPIDPLGGGLAEAIQAEQCESEAIRNLYDGVDPDALSQRWGALLDEAHHDPEWFDFADD